MSKKWLQVQWSRKKFEKTFWTPKIQNTTLKNHQVWDQRMAKNEEIIF